ncbi:hypothetical protein AAFG13_37875 [Bradyrhizobium sp. B124]|uniref:IS66 family transposase n=1 Tax=Bradyrhizobium sp. B124 TaxID=3140245 RepID=UPI00318414DC
MTSKPDDLPADLASAYMALLAERKALQVERDIAVADAASARAELSDNEALIAHLELRIEKLKRELYGPRSERTARLIEQLELELEELITMASEDELAARAAAAKVQNVRAFTRKRPVRKPWPDDIERERVVIEAPTSCACCGGARLAKLGEDVTETLEEILRRFKLIGDGSRKVHLPRLRENQPAARAVPCHTAWLHRSATAGDNPVRQVRHAYPAQPSERAL